MDSYKPTDEDFIFTSNGYKCGIGIYYIQGRDEPDQAYLQLTKQKVAGGSENQYSDWEMLHTMYYVNTLGFASPQECMAEFLAGANPKLIAATGGEVPPAPETFLASLEHLCRYGLAFNAQTGEVFLK